MSVLAREQEAVSRHFAGLPQEESEIRMLEWVGELHTSRLGPPAPGA